MKKIKSMAYMLLIVLLGLSLNTCGSGSDTIDDYIDDLTGRYTISGTVSGAVAANVTIRLTGAETENTTTAADGTYEFDGLADGTYTVTPVLAGYTFTPASRQIVIAGADMTANFTAASSSAATPYEQTDLQATWDVQILEAGNINGWGRYNVTVSAAGGVTFNSCQDSTGSTACPAGPIVWTINPNTGVITETNNGADTDNHYAITLNKNFVAGTASGSSQLLIAQKRVSGVAYSNSDLQSKHFVIHSLMVGGENKWLHEVGSTDANRVVTLTSSTDPGGTDNNAENTGITISVDANGVVTMNGTMSSYRGFMSYDKRTIVGTFTENGDTYQLMVIQITDGQTGNSVSDVAGTWIDHILAVGGADFWAHQNIAINNTGVMTFSNWVDNDIAISGPDATETIAIGSTGTATIQGTDFHGQLSYDGQFLIGTRTIDLGSEEAYAFHVSILSAAGSTSTTTYSLSGAVSGATLADVLITLSGAATDSTTTSSSGAFSFTGLANGSYTLTPSKTGYTFTPSSLPVTISGANATGSNFTATSSSTDNSDCPTWFAQVDDCCETDYSTNPPSRMIGFLVPKRCGTCPSGSTVDGEDLVWSGGPYWMCGCDACSD